MHQEDAHHWPAAMGESRLLWVLRDSHTSVAVLRYNCLFRMQVQHICFDLPATLCACAKAMGQQVGRTALMVHWWLLITRRVLPQACASVVVRERRCTGVGVKFVLASPLKFFTIAFSISFTCKHECI